MPLWIKADHALINSVFVKYIDIHGRTIRLLEQKPKAVSSDIAEALAIITCPTEKDAETRILDLYDQLNIGPKG